MKYHENRLKNLLQITAFILFIVITSISRLYWRFYRSTTTTCDLSFNIWWSTVPTIDIFYKTSNTISNLVFIQNDWHFSTSRCWRCSRTLAWQNTFTLQPWSTYAIRKERCKVTWSTILTTFQLRKGTDKYWQKHCKNIFKIETDSKEILKENACKTWREFFLVSRLLFEVYEILLEIQWFCCSAVSWRHYNKTIESPIESNTIHDYSSSKNNTKKNWRWNVLERKQERCTKAKKKRRSHTV
jgi:hypothetical protein